MFPQGRRRAALGLLLLASVLAACDRTPKRPAAPAARFAAAKEAAPPPPAQAWFTQATAQGAALGLAYTHAVGLEVSGGAIGAHFNAARDRCLNTPTLQCILLRAEFGTVPAYGEPAGGALRSQGSLALRLPHDQIAGFAASLTAPLAGEQAGLVRVIRQSMTAEDLSQPIADTGQRVAQLQSYLASLKALGDRLTIGVGDLVKIAGETARTQTEIEAAQAEQRNLARQVNTEELDISFEEPAPPSPPAPDPITQSWSSAQDTLDRNVAVALDAGIAAIPWIPFAGVGLALLWLMRVVVFGKRRK
jgi:hypothetical protein